ncbi:uncharacterized protein ACNLHF_014513 isoform 2-T2 [Anomaloglossus baeobatrachus]|uniref:uncharacterized protein LOC142302587 isoform X2 n=1 Tax=Anomaloglossus baeobatrachus TaxID=238106 RepID=UPI003F50B6CC
MAPAVGAVSPAGTDKDGGGQPSSAARITGGAAGQGNSPPSREQEVPAARRSPGGGSGARRWGGGPGKSGPGQTGGSPAGTSRPRRQETPRMGRGMWKLNSSLLEEATVRQSFEEFLQSQIPMQVQMCIS